jgi:hypothetical protein
VSDSSLQSHSGANLNPKRAKNRGNVPKGGEADGVALTSPLIVTYRSYPEERRFGKGRRLQLMGCAPDVLLVLSICGSQKIGVRSEVTWSKNQSRSRRYGSRRSEDTGLEVRDVGESERT